MRSKTLTALLIILSTYALAQPEEPAKVITSTGKAPSDAIVLFDGTDFSEWQKGDGSQPGWKIENGAMTVVKGTGDIMTKRSFGDIQLHIEWRAPKERNGEGQLRGNSGIFLQNRYEIQVLDCWENTTYTVGQAGAIYNQYPPLVNPCNPSGEWQSYDIIYHAPRFNPRDQSLLEEARVTVLMNGVLIHDNVAIKGLTVPSEPVYEYHQKQPIRIQDHNDGIEPSTSFRNIWVRELN